MNIKKIDPTPPRQVKKLPKRAVEGEIVLNKADGFFYLGVKEDKQIGSNVEKNSL